MRTPRSVLFLMLAALLVAAATAAAVSSRFSPDDLHRHNAFSRYAALFKTDEKGSASILHDHWSFFRPVAMLSGLLRKVWRPWWVRGVAFVYFTTFCLLMFNHRAQTYLIYLHWVRPPSFISSCANLGRHGLAGYTRNVEAGHLRGWHLLPSGPPFAVDEADFEKRLKEPRARVIIFFHGNSGTRAFPPKRVRILQMLASHFRAHVFSFDYSGFGDSGGRPSETQLFTDARVVYAFVHARVAKDAHIVIYGQSLGTFAAVDVAAYLSKSSSIAGGMHGGVVPAAVILEAPPASLMDAARSHPSVALFRILPGVDAVFRNLLKEKLDSLSKVGQIRLPLLVLHGCNDTFIPVTQGKKLFERAKSTGNNNAYLVEFPNCGHVNVASQDTYLSTLHEFLERYAPLP